ncbi:hypothetical protein M426DRAFT_10396 [Hypoxylon sp. CI-4A]|nr:hypothetical protein M426DRAFT_10396 [Hypoxylon sp. CI-4A]
MDIDEDEILRTIANGGSIDYSIWPALLPVIIARIEKNAQYEFTIPNLPTPAPTIIPSSIPPPQTRSESDPADNFLSPLPSSPLEPSSTTSSQENKENTPIPSRVNHPTSAPASATPLPPGALPPQITSMLTEITTTLTNIFPKYPPHTLQRLAELVLMPKQHYRSLPTYLHALDRVVHVTSGLNVYPLPPAIPDMKSASLLSNGLSDLIPTPSPWASPGSDEALGGALLTPIPWLQPNHHGIGGGPAQSSLGTPGQRSPTGSGQNSPGSAGPMGGSDLEGEVRTESTETIDGPNGVGSIETVSVSVNGIPSMGARGVGVTQGELLRQEQRAGVVPVSQLVPSHHVHAANPHAQVHRRASASPTAEGGANSPTTATAGGQSGSPDPERKSKSPPSGADAANETASSASSSSSSGVSGTTTATTTTTSADVDVDAPIGSVTGTDEEKPHARGPEEIGPEDMGPQHGTGSSSITSTTSGPGGREMHGIDVEAAVGRKATSGRAGSGSPPKDDGGGGGGGDDKMDVEAPATPKREADEELESGGKKLREDPDAAAASSDDVVGAEAADADADADAEEGPAADPMDTSKDGPGDDGKADQNPNPSPNPGQESELPSQSV